MGHIFIISDGTGKTAEQAMNAALTQFSETEVIITKYSDVRTQEQVQQIINSAKQMGAFIVHTVVSTELRHLILQTGRLHNVETIFANQPSWPIIKVTNKPIEEIATEILENMQRYQIIKEYHEF